MTLVPNYVPTDWVDHVTPVDEAHMDKIDVAVDAHADAINALDTRLVTQEGKPGPPTVVNGKWLKGVGGAMVWSDIAIADVASLQTSLNAKQDLSAKGQVNGYASLDGTGKVPTSQIPAGNIDLRWAGTYSAATAYNEGDIVISNGISYMALRSNTGETPTPWGSGLLYQSTLLSADVTMTTANLFYDGPSLLLAAGTWLLIGAILVNRGANGGPVTAKLWDGTTVYSSAEGSSTGLTSGQAVPLNVFAVVALGASATLKISVASSATTHAIKAATPTNSAGSNASSLTAVKLG